MTTIKSILKTPIQKLENPIFSFKRTNEAEVRNSKILAAFNGDLGATIASQNNSPLNYGSYFLNTADLSKLFYYHADKINITNIIHQGSRYHLDTIKEGTRKSYLDGMILRGNQKYSHSEMNPATLDKPSAKILNTDRHYPSQSNLPKK